MTKKKTEKEYRKWIDTKLTKNYKVAFPLGKRKGKHIPIQIKFDGMWVDFNNCAKAFNTLYKEIVPFGSAGRLHVLKKLYEPSSKSMNWFNFIMLTEMLGQSPDKLWKILGKYFREEKVRKLKVAMVNPAMAAVLINKINRWGGVPAAWQDHRGYINSWCKRTGTPLFKSLSNFADYVTAWREATVGKRKHKERMKKKNVTESVDREFSILNRPPKS